MMNKQHTHIIGSFQSAAKLAVLLCIALHSHAADIFSQREKDRAPEEPIFSTVAALLDATRSGDVPNALTSDDPKIQQGYRKGVGNSVLRILQQENLFSKDKLRYDTGTTIGFLFAHLSKYELSGQKDEYAPENFQRAWKDFCEFYGSGNPRLTEKLDLIFKEYSQAVKESLIHKKERDDRRMAESAERQRQADVAIQRMSEAAAQKKAVADSEAASKRAVDDARAAAVKGAMEAQAEVRKKKLEQILASPAYQLWRASVQVEEGVRMIENGRAALAKETGIERESGVQNLTARRAAGEQVAAGKLLVEKSFRNYRELGGDAATPEEVKAGPDPAAEYR